MNLDNAKDWGLFACLAVFVIKQLFDMLKQRNAESREDVKAVGIRLTSFEERFETKLDSLADKVMEVTLQAERLLSALKMAAQKDTDFHDRQLPALEQKVSRIDFEVRMVREGLNEVRHTMGMPPICQTPADGMPITIGVPVRITD